MEAYRCDVCGKRFAREGNLAQHRKKHGLYQCSDCPQAFTTENNLELHRYHRHGQSGRGKKRTNESPQSGPSMKRRITRMDDPTVNYRVTPLCEQKMRKFNTTANRYPVHFQDLDIRYLPNILQSLRRLFSSVIKDLTGFMDSGDLIRLTVQCPELDYPISLPFMRVAQLSADRLLTEIERVLQSYEEFVVDQSLEMEVIHVKLPSGKGHKKKCFVDLERELTKKKCFIRIKNKDDLCCARAIITARAKLDKDQRWNSIRQGRNIQRTLAEELHKLANVPPGQCDLEDVKAFQSVLPGYQIHVLSKDCFNAIVYQGPEAEKKIYLYHHKNHYDVITTMSGFLNRSYFCQKCQKGFNTKEKHICNEPCHLCHRCHDDQSENWQYCSTCKRHFKNTTCFQLHAELSSQGNSTCHTYYRCRQCSTTVNRNKSRQPHVCGNKYCDTCKMFMSEDHVCYMKTTAEEEETKLLKRKRNVTVDEDDEQLKQWIFFDFECTQDDMIQCDGGYFPQISIKCGNCHRKNCHSNPCEQGFVPRKITSCKNCNQSSCGSYRHVPNLCVVHKVCEECIDEDEINEHSYSSSCQYKQRIFNSPNTRDDFCKWLFSDENEGAKIFCHNFRWYDSYPIVSYLYENAILPEVIMNGSKFMSIEIPRLKMKFLDSMNFIPMALSKMPKAFDIPEVAKGYFPHLYNRKENQRVIVNHLPDVQFYNADGMMPDDRTKFLQWYKEHQHDSFDFQKEIIKYCRSDVDILRRGCLKFRDIFMDMTSRDDRDGVDPFERCITIASDCNLVFRSLFLERESIGIIPPQGYRPKDRQSVKAMQWIKYHAHQTNIDIQHAGNVGEKAIGPYRVDGYYEIGNQKIVMEFHGDYWHGNPKCYSANTLNKVVGMTMGDLYQRTLVKRRYLESLGYTYLQMWESDFDRAVESTDEMKSFLEHLELTSPLQPRDAFFGGRTEAFKLHAQAGEDTDIKYFDVTSLYPFINKTGKIPLGRPQIVTENFDLLQNYEGLIKCRILPPKHLYMPVLPSKINNKLLFGLCRTCMEKQIQTCEHTDRERMISGTWVTDEVKKSRRNGLCNGQDFRSVAFRSHITVRCTNKIGRGIH